MSASQSSFPGDGLTIARLHHHTILTRPLGLAAAVCLAALWLPEGSHIPATRSYVSRKLEIALKADTLHFCKVKIAF
jgi:hypothetical protein